jgi:hypothetical protein
VTRADSLLGDIRDAETRADRLYRSAEKILELAIAAKDPKSAINAIKAAVNVMAEARQYLALRGDLTGELEQRRPALDGVITILALPKTVPSRAPARNTSHVLPVETATS